MFFWLEEPETIEHFFFSCLITLKFWQDLFSWLNIDINTDIPSQNLFQVLVYADGLSKKMSFMLNIIITMGKYHVHKSKWNNSKPSLNCFKNECKKYLESLKHLSKDNQPLGELYNVWVSFLLSLVRFCTCIFFIIIFFSPCNPPEMFKECLFYLWLLYADIYIYIYIYTHMDIYVWWRCDWKSVYFVIGILLFPIWVCKLILFNKNKKELTLVVKARALYRK